MQNTIERSIDISAPLERVWELVTEPGWWVPVETPVVPNRTVGHVAIRESEKYGRFPVEVVDLKPMTYAAFRWASSFPGSDLDAGKTTLIEFTVKETAEGVHVSVVESGFAQLDAADEIKGQSFENNSGGWTAELDSLKGRAEA